MLFDQGDYPLQAGAAAAQTQDIDPRSAEGSLASRAVLR